MERRADLATFAGVRCKVLAWVPMLRASLTPYVRMQRVARSAYYRAFAGWGIPERAIRALNADTGKTTWDGAFSAAPRSA